MTKLIKKTSKKKKKSIHDSVLSHWTWAIKEDLNITLYAKINSFIYIAMMMAFSEWFISGSTKKTAQLRLRLELCVF